MSTRHPATNPYLMRPAFLFFLILTLLTANHLTAQESTRTRELGIRLNNLETFGFIYKKSLAENTFRRYRFFSGQLDFVNVDGS